MEDFKFATAISTHENKNRHLSRLQRHLVESIMAAICGASIPAVVFYFFI